MDGYVMSLEGIAPFFPFLKKAAYHFNILSSCSLIILAGSASSLGYLGSNEGIMASEATALPAWLYPKNFVPPHRVERWTKT